MLDNRIGMDENGTQTWTLYDGSDPIMDFNSSGSLEMRYLNGPTGDLVDAVIARESAGGTIAWYLPDRLGTIRDLINNSGSVIDHVDCSVFGTVLDESSPSNGDRMMGFAGMERDTVTGLSLAVNRVQDPGTGRWTSEDPLGFNGGDTDLYRYVGNDSTNERDPVGEVPPGSVLQPGGGRGPTGNILPPLGLPVDEQDMAYLNELLQMVWASLRELNGSDSGGLVGQYLGLMPSVKFYPTFLGSGSANGYTMEGPGWPGCLGDLHLELALNPSGAFILVPIRSINRPVESQTQTLLHEIWHYTGFVHGGKGPNRAELNADELLECVKNTRAYKNFKTKYNDIHTVPRIRDRMKRYGAW